MKVIGIGPTYQLLQCPRCSEVIDALSRECRYCHRTLTTTELRSAAERYARIQSEESVRRDRRTRWFAVRGLIALVVLMGLKVLELYVPSIARKNSLELAFVVLTLMYFLERYVTRIRRAL